MSIQYDLERLKLGLDHSFFVVERPLPQLISGTAGADLIRGNSGDDRIVAGAGGDTVTWSARDPLAVIYGVPILASDDGRDVIFGGAGLDRFLVQGNGEAETYKVFTREAWIAQGGEATMLDPVSEVVVTRTGASGTARVIAELESVESILVHGGSGADMIEMIGDFSALGLTAQFVPGRMVEGFAPSARDVTQLADLVNGIQPDPANDDNADSLGPRSLSGHGNNVDQWSWGAAGEPYVRVTSAHYGAFDPDTGNHALNPIFEGLDPRNISNALGAVPENMAPSPVANAFFTAFGQYFDHGLGFLVKGGNGSVEIGGPGTDRSGTNPADLTRGRVMGFDPDTGMPLHENQTSPYVDQNQAYGSSDLVGQLLREGDGAQGFGAALLSGAADPSNPDFNLLPTLRKLLDHHIAEQTLFQGAGLPTEGMKLTDYYPGLVQPEGGYDPAVVASLSADFMGEGFPLLIDTNPFINLLDHVVAGDGRANENLALTSMHTIWARNHNFHVEGLREAGFEGDAEALFQAAKVINEAEYQRVVFTEFAEKLLGPLGIQGLGDHGFEAYNPDANAGISQEFAAAAYRVGHTLITEMVTVLDPDGTPRQISLFDAFLNPSNDPDGFTLPLETLAQYGYVPQPGYAEYGAGGILGGVAGQPAEEVDTRVVDAVRNDLVRISADLFAFNTARGRDLGLGTLNQVRADLMASVDPHISEAVGLAGDLRPYDGWDDFQARNELSNAAIAEFRQAYPDLVLSDPDAIVAFVAANPDVPLFDNGDGSFTVSGIDRVDLWVGGLAEAKIQGGMVGSTFWVILHDQFDRLQEGDLFYYLQRVEAFDFYIDFVENQSFSDIVARTTGLTGLDEDIFGVSTDMPIAMARREIAANLKIAEGSRLVGTGEEDVLIGTDADETILALNGNDTMLGGGGDDELWGHGGDDLIMGGEGADFLVGSRGNDVLAGGEGNDLFRYAWRDGFDTIDGGLDIDRLEIVGGAGAQRIEVVQNGSIISQIVGLASLTSVEEIALDTRSGRDVLDYRPSVGTDTDVVVNLATGQATGFSSITGIRVVIGSRQDDTLIDDANANTLFGSNGDDVLVAAVDNLRDDFMGQRGNDTVDYSAYETGVSIALETGMTVVAVGSGSTEATSDRLQSIQHLIGSQGDDTLIGKSSAGAHNTLSGGDGNDTLIGLNGRDVLNGGAGMDRLVGGRQADTLTGGADDDVFVFETILDAPNLNNADRILDFEGAGVAGGDRIDLAGLGAMDFIGTASFSAGPGGQVRYVQDAVADETRILIDTDLDPNREMVIRVDGLHDFNADDFILTM